MFNQSTFSFTPWVDEHDNDCITLYKSGGIRAVQETAMVLRSGVKGSRKRKKQSGGINPAGYLQDSSVQLCLPRSRVVWRPTLPQTRSIPQNENLRLVTDRLPPAALLLELVPPHPRQAAVDPRRVSVHPHQALAAAHLSRGAAPRSRAASPAD